MAKKYFAYSADSGFELFDTQVEAEAAAESIIAGYLEDAFDGGWDEDVESVCWGEVKQHTVMADKLPAPDGSPFDYTCDYVLSNFNA